MAEGQGHAAVVARLEAVEAERPVAGRGRAQAGAKKKR
jgi:hypothetical protein